MPKINNEDSTRRADLLRDINVAMRQSSGQGALFEQAIAERLKMNPTDLECLAVLGDTGPATAGKLADLTGLTTGAITGVVDRLEKEGYVRRENDPNDRRRVIIALQPARLHEVAPLYEPLSRAVGDLCARYNDQELTLLLDFLRGSQVVMHDETARLRGESTQTVAGDNDFSSPLGSVKSGQLVFTKGTANISIRGGKPGKTGRAELFHAQFEGSPPTVKVDGGVVTIRQKHGNWLRPTSGEVILNAAIPWRISLQGGAAKVEADLRAIQLTAFEVTGGANELELRLPPPTGTVSLRIASGASKTNIYRPPGVAARIRISSGAMKVTLDGNFIGTTGPMNWETPDYKKAKDRYDIELAGGASLLTVDASAR